MTPKQKELLTKTDCLDNYEVMEDNFYFYIGVAGREEGAYMISRSTADSLASTYHQAMLQVLAYAEDKERKLSEKKPESLPTEEVGRDVSV